MEFRKQKTLSNRSVSTFCGEMAEMLKAGISSTEALSILMEDAQSEQEKAMLQKMYDELTATGSFSEAVEAAGQFPPYMRKMVSLGEQTGRLDDVMDTLGQYYDREDEISRAVKTAVIYPLVMVAMMLAIVLVLLTQVLPVFQRVFDQLGMEMNAFSTGLLQVGQVLSRYSIVCIAVAVAIIAALLIITQRVMKRSVLSSKMALCRFASGMAMTLSSGLPQEQSLELAGELAQNPGVQAKIKQSETYLNEGDGLAEALSKSKIFTGIRARMVMIGNRTGALEETMSHIAEEYQNEIDDDIARRIAVIEPTLVVILSVITGVILLSIMLPLLGILSSL